ncbi:MAG TPA: hypothetical protein PLI43_10975 [Albidovulum sp.]|nr:hypothetical protein [Albidovulum sp.]
MEVSIITVSEFLAAEGRRWMVSGPKGYPDVVGQCREEAVEKADRRAMDLGGSCVIVIGDPLSIRH